MLAIISPAKTLDFENPAPKSAVLNLTVSQPRLLTQSQQLINTCQQLTPAEVASLMSISDKLAGLNVARFAQWQQEHHLQNSKEALFAFQGDVYTGLEAEKFTPEDTEFAQQHLRMLSGLYGLLRPLDLMQPYRLEMGTKLATTKGKNLYSFWGNTITNLLQQDLQEQNDKVLINLASDEYFKAIQPESLSANIIKPIFLDYKNGKYKVISFYAKKARGMMCRYLIQQRLTQPEQLKQFDLDGYWFDEANSSEHEYIFKRDNHE